MDRSLHEHKITIGVSLDGPRDLHDRYRKFRNGSGSYDRVVAGIRKLQARNYPFHFIGVVTAQSLPRAADLLADYWSFHPTALGLNIDELEAQNRHSSLGEDITTERFERFIAELLDAGTRQDGPAVTIRDFQRTLSSLISGKPEDNDQVIPLRMLNVVHNGDITRSLRNCSRSTLPSGGASFSATFIVATR